MSRWITVANRLPFTVSADLSKITAASGGLVSALSGVQGQGKRVWIGAAPDHVTPTDWPSIEARLQNEPATSWTYQPVFLEKPLYDSYYNGLCNDVLWPLLHYQPELIRFTDESWTSYRQVNEKVAAEIAKMADANDLIWIHDFHFFLVPKLLKALRPELRVGFFLHVPFPGLELYRQLAVREDILEGVLAADLIGFHDDSYVQHFRDSAVRLLGAQPEYLGLRYQNRSTRLGVFPVSIDTSHFIALGAKPDVATLTKTIGTDEFTFLGVDRLDYMKGIDLKLNAFRKLLKTTPELRGKVRLIQIAVPTRQGVPAYQRLAAETARLVGEINGDFSTLTWTPVHYIYGSVNATELAALYKSSDALLVTSKRDGMNLVALEYIACQDTLRPGVVLLSEFAGASASLSHVLTINPSNEGDVVKQMKLAISMPPTEKIERSATMLRFLKSYDATAWAESFIHDLEEQMPIDKLNEPLVVKPTVASCRKVCDRLLALKPSRVVLFCDYDGTLVPIEKTPELAVLTASVRKDLQSFRNFPWLDLVIVSGRDRRFLDRQFSGLDLTMAAEHGARVFDSRSGCWLKRVRSSRARWYPSVLKTMRNFGDRTPGSRVEQKDYSIAWHYRQAPEDYGDAQARKLAQELELGLANFPVTVLRGSKVIEVRAMEADKGLFAAEYLANAPAGTVAIAIGDDRTDEDLFEAVSGRGVSIHVGSGASAAEFALSSQPDALTFLQMLMAELQPSMNSMARFAPVETVRRDGRKPSTGRSSFDSGSRGLLN